jgi:hypothetical protein
MVGAVVGEPRRCAARTAALLLVLLLGGACGGGEGGDGTRPTMAPTRTPTATLPSPTRSADESDGPELPSLTRSPSESDVPDEPREETSTGAEPSAEPTTEPVAPGSSEGAAEAPAADEDVPSWVWWLVGVLAVGTAAGLPLVARARRRGRWRRELAAAESEIAWFARVLLPGLRQVGSLEQVAGGWSVGEGRVAAAEDRLTALEPAAPTDADRERARSLRDAVRLARGRVQQLTTPGRHDTWASDLDAIIADLEAVLGPPAVATPAAGERPVVG